MSPAVVDPYIWKACAGTSVQILTVDSVVYYFPQGHAEQSYDPPDFSSISYNPCYVLCRIVSVDFLADKNTDEVFAKLRLQPLSQPPLTVSASMCSSISISDLSDGGDPPVVSFAKILTPSDANNGGGFSVPRFCADSIFPELDYEAEPPVQVITIRDVHGTTYDFRHIYRGTPRRHLLTTGWSKFVNQKKLVAGDSVVFIKNRGGELFVGVRRTGRSCGVASIGDCSRWAAEKVEDDSGGFSRSGRGKVSPESVVEAVGLAASGMPFEVVYYPRAGLPDFVVPVDVVDEAIRVCWMAGMRVKMAVETDDSSRMTWYQGTVLSVATQDPGKWPNSLWRILQVKWDESDVLQNVKKVSPWQVELVSTTPQIQPPFHPTKKMRSSSSSDTLTGGEGPRFLQTLGLTSAMIGQFNASMLNYNIFPAGMQGARHDPIGISSLTNLISNNHPLSSDNFCSDNIVPNLSVVSTELNIGSSSQSENSSPQSQGNSHFISTGLSCDGNCNPIQKAGFISFQLFGQTIHTKQPVADDFDNSRCTGNVVGKGSEMTKGMGGPIDSPLAYPQKQLCNQIDVRYQRVSALKMCSL